MFKFPYNWLVRESEIPVNYDKLMKWLEEQGFEIASLSDLGDDKLIEIEVKANRPDMLSIAGVLREYYCACNEPKPKDYSLDLGLSFSQDCSVLGHKITVNSSDVHRYYAVGIAGIDNTANTPSEIADVLTKLGIGTISPVVDISNYVMLLIGQPTHIFDSDKVSGNITIANESQQINFTSLSGAESVFPENAVFIKDERDFICAAGIVGGTSAAVDSATRNIIIESANFDHIIERVASKKSHVSTLASYRYERGVSVATAKIGLNLVAAMIHDVCGGEISLVAYEYTDDKEDAHSATLSISRTNNLLGTNLSKDEISSYLQRCFFAVDDSDNDSLLVHVPSFRLDIEDQVDLIEEVGRIYGYHNIVPQPVKMGIQLTSNPLNETMKHLREVMVGFSGVECITYGFIPDNAMDILGIKNTATRFYGDIKILNPLSNYYALMRPTLVYSLLTTAIDNIKSGCKKVNIFELGRTFYRQKDHEYGYNQRDTLGGILYGVNQPKGFGIVRDNMFSVYDALAIINALLGEYNTSYVIQKTDELGFLKDGACGYIVINNSIAGCVGVVSQDVLKQFGVEKIIASDMLYYELDFDNLSESKKAIQHERRYASVKREYNFIVKNGIYFADYKQDIFNADPCVIAVKAIDVYKGKGIESGFASVLVEVEYNDPSKAIEIERVTQIEAAIYNVLNARYGIALKQ